jgi:hypothetical protein
MGRQAFADESAARLSEGLGLGVDPDHGMFGAPVTPYG